MRIEINIDRSKWPLWPNYIYLKRYEQHQIWWFRFYICIWTDVDKYFLDR